MGLNSRWDVFNDSARQVGAAAISREGVCINLIVLTCKQLDVNGMCTGSCWSGCLRAAIRGVPSGSCIC